MDLEKLDDGRKGDELSAVPILRQQDSGFDLQASGPHAHGPSQSHRVAKGRHKKPLRQTAILRKPLSDDTGPWVKAEHEATEWLSLFYDLVMVAVLTVFSNAHELSAPKAIPAFFSYFVIIYWIWVSQTHYDTRYQSDDALHIMMKFCQISVLIYIGAASGNWSPFNLPMVPVDRATDGDESFSAIAEGIRDSFETVVSAYIASRVILAFQYGVAAIMGKRAKRRTKQFALSISVLLFSAALALTAVLIPIGSSGSALAKILLFYCGIVVEVVVAFVQIYLHWHINPASHKVAERYAALTLILLGEGFISLTRAFKKAVSGLSDRDSNTYSQVFLSIAIIFLLWGFLFSRFHKDDDVSPRRRLAWEIIHFPLAFVLLLFLGAMINTVLIVGTSAGTTMVLNSFTQFLDKAIAGTLSIADSARAARYLDKLTLSPTWETELSVLRESAVNPAAKENATIMAVQYLAQIVVQSINTYGLELNENVAHLYDTLNAVNTTQTSNVFEMDLKLATAAGLTEDIVNESFNELFSGVSWLYPTAGAVLLLCAVRSMLWYRFDGPGHIIIHSFQIGAGLILGMLGMLNIGPAWANFTESEGPGWIKTANPMYQVALTSLPLVIVMLTYLVTYLGSTCALAFAHWKRGDIYGRDEEIRD